LESDRKREFHILFTPRGIISHQVAQSLDRFKSSVNIYTDYRSINLKMLVVPKKSQLQNPILYQKKKKLNPNNMANATGLRRLPYKGISDR